MMQLNKLAMGRIKACKSAINWPIKYIQNKGCIRGSITTLVYLRDMEASQRPPTNTKAYMKLNKTITKQGTMNKLREN